MEILPGHSQQILVLSSLYHTPVTDLIKEVDPEGLLTIGVRDEDTTSDIILGYVKENYMARDYVWSITDTTIAHSSTEVPQTLIEYNVYQAPRPMREPHTKRMGDEDIKKVLKWFVQFKEDERTMRKRNLKEKKKKGIERSKVEAIKYMDSVESIHKYVEDILEIKVDN